MSLAQHIYEKGCKCPEPCPYHPASPMTLRDELVKMSKLTKLYSIREKMLRRPNFSVFYAVLALVELLIEDEEARILPPKTDSQPQSAPVCTPGT